MPGAGGRGRRAAPCAGLAVVAVALGVLRGAGGDDTSAACSTSLPPQLPSPTVQRCNDDYECIGLVYGCWCPENPSQITSSCSPYPHRRQGKCLCKKQPTPAGNNAPAWVSSVESVALDSFVEHVGNSHTFVECPFCKSNYLGQLGSNDPQVSRRSIHGSWLPCTP